MTTRLLRHEAAVRRRLSATCACLGIVQPQATDDVARDLRDIMTLDGPSTDARTAAVILAATGRYPRVEELDALAGWLSTGDVEEAWTYLMRLVKRASKSSLRRQATPAPATVVDLTRTSRTTEVTGIPRVASGLAGEAVKRGAALLVWGGGAPGEVSLDAHSMVAFPPSSWRRAGDRRRAVRMIKRAYWALIGWMSRWPSGFRAARAFRATTAPVGDALFGRGGPETLALLGPVHYVSPEVNRPDVVDRLLAWHRAQPGMRLTVVLHDLLPVVTPRFFAPDQRLEHVDFIRLVAASDDLVVASPHLLPQVEGLRLLHGDSTPQRVRIVPLGLSTAAWTARATPAAGPPEFVMVGSMEPRKNHALALHALGSLARDGHPCVLHIVGHARPVHPLTRDALGFARRCGTTVVEHRGIDDNALLGLMRNCRAAFYLSWAEGYGLPVLEALATGLPVFASDIPSNRPHLRYGGVVLVPPNRPDILRDELERFLTDPGVEADLRASIVSEDLPMGYETWAGAVLDGGDVPSTAHDRHEGVPPSSAAG